MADEKQGKIQTSSDGGVIGNHPAPDQFQFLVGSATGSEFNTARLRLIPIACFRIDDVRFKFDSSFVLPGVKDEMTAFADLRKNDSKVMGAPISIFGHADPAYHGNFEPDSSTANSGDDYNKTLSGRRAIAIYALLTRDASLWNNLYNNHVGGDVWGEDSIRTMLQAVDPPKPASGTQQSLAPPSSTSAASGDTGPSSSEPQHDPRVQRCAADAGQRQQLFLQYMDVICPGVKLDKSNDFLGRGAGPDLKADVQGCSRFNPLIVFSHEKEARFKQAYQGKDKATLAQRDANNAANRRVMILIFRKGSQVLPSKWPCPTYKEGPAGCKKRFFSDGDKRRSTHDSGADRKFDKTHDTYACRFYQRLSEGGPCNEVVHYWVMRLLAEGTGPLSKRKPLANEPYVLTGSGSPLPEIRGVTDPLGILRVPVVTPTCIMTLKIAGVTVILNGGALLSLRDGDEAVKSRLYSLGYGTPDTENWNDDTFSDNLKQFQKDQSLQESGSVDSDTESKLKEVYGS